MSSPTPKVVNAKRTPERRRWVADQSITAVCIPGHTMRPLHLYQTLPYNTMGAQYLAIQWESRYSRTYIYLSFNTLVQIMPTIQIHKLSSNHDDPCTEFPGLELFKCTMPNPNGVSAERGWLVFGNSSAWTLPIISFTTVLPHSLPLGSEGERSIMSIMLRRIGQWLTLNESKAWWPFSKELYAWKSMSLLFKGYMSNGWPS